MADTLSKIREDLEQRLRELEPLIQEYAQVRQTLDALRGAGSRVHGPARSGAKARAAAKTATAPARQGRPAGSGARAQEALRHVHESPGVTIAQMAKKMKIKPNYLYRVLPQLVKDGKIKKAGTGYHPHDD